jgi:hypothetical protein
MRSENSGANVMRNIIRCLIWILVTWIGSWYLTLSTAVVATERSPEGVIKVDFPAADLAMTASLPDRRRNGDNEIILDDRDDLDVDAVVTGLEDKQFFSPIGDLPYHHVPVAVYTSALRSASFVEPRFLRYSRLLN